MLQSIRDFACGTPPLCCCRDVTSNSITGGTFLTQQEENARLITSGLERGVVFELVTSFMDSTM